jgi:hypothetical protein
MSFSFWPVPGLFFHPFLLYFLWYVVYATSLVGVALRDANGIRRHQYAYMLAASIIGYAGGATNFPLWYGVPLLPYGTVLITMYTALMAYTIVRYRLMNISVVLNKGLGYAIVLAIIVVATSIGAVLSNRATGHSTPPLLAGTLFLICALLGAQQQSPFHVEYDLQRGVWGRLPLVIRLFHAVLRVTRG